MKRKILILNPNSTAQMTAGLQNTLQGTALAQKNDLIFTNPPNGPPSINNEDDAVDSVAPCISHINEHNFLSTCDAFLVACYSVHPLVKEIGSLLAAQGTLPSQKPVLGIFEASVLASIASGLGDQGKFGIVSTGKVWEELLTNGVQQFSASSRHPEMENRFAGVETTGLNATELHDAPKDVVDGRLKEATKRLARKGNVTAICLGCAGMTGMDEVVRAALVEELGEEEGRDVFIVDGVLEGVRILGGQ